MRFVAVVVSVLAAVLIGATPAYAHVALLSSDPEDGAKLAKAPSRVVLTFSDPLDASLTRVAVTIDDKPVTLASSARTEGNTVTVPLAGGGGSYLVAYRVVGSDGHRIDGEIGFTVTGRSSPAATGAGAVGSPGHHHDGAAPTKQAGTVTRSWVWLVVGLGAVLLLGGLAYVLTVGRKRSEDVPDGGGRGDD
jgi:methionine-rich copper-binding protein CopC